MEDHGRKDHLDLSSYRDCIPSLFHVVRDLWVWFVSAQDSNDRGIIRKVHPTKGYMDAGSDLERG